MGKREEEEGPKLTGGLEGLGYKQIWSTVRARSNYKRTHTAQPKARQPAGRVFSNDGYTFPLSSTRRRAAASNIVPKTRLPLSPGHDDEIEVRDFWISTLEPKSIAKSCCSSSA